jgi:flagellar biosynthesis protein FliR
MNFFNAFKLLVLINLNMTAILMTSLYSSIKILNININITLHHNSMG